MPDLTPETQEQLRAQCRKISVAHNLRPEQAQELYTHMETQMAAYLSGKKSITESDAVILVQQHFGDPRMLKQLLGNVHAVASKVNLARRLGAVLAASLALLAAKRILTTLMMIGLVEWSKWSQLSEHQFAIARSSFTLVLSILYVACLWLLVRHWQRCIHLGKCPWFCTCAPPRFVYLLLLLTFLAFVTPIGTSTSAMGSALFRTPPAIMWLLTGEYFGTCLAWLWFCDVAPRRISACLSSLIIWMAFSVVTTTFWLSFGPLLVVDLTSWHINVGPVLPVVRLAGLTAVLKTVIYSSILGIAAAALYLVVTRFKAKHADI